MSTADRAGTRLLDTKDAVDLASAWLCHRARQAGVRALLVKGPVAAELGLRPARVSSDADILVEPSRAADFARHLATFGWRERPEPGAPRIVDAHSVSLLHDDWPIDLDVHSYWPGFLADRTEVFDALWASRIEPTLAGVRVAAPSAEGMALILALHTLRRPLGRDRARVDALGALVAATREVLPESTGERLQRFAVTLGAEQTAEPFLTMLGMHVEPDPQPSVDLQLWRLKADTRGNVSAWFLEFRRERGLGRVHVVRRALLPGSAELRRVHPDLPPGIRGDAVGWVRRWRSGLVELPRTVSALRNLRTGRKHGHR